MENSYNSIAELLNSDSESRTFFASLPSDLRKKLMKSDINNFQSLKEAAQQNTFRTSIDDGFYQYYNSACSYNDCTGLIPNGVNQTPHDINNYKDIFPFGDPNK